MEEPDRWSNLESNRRRIPGLFVPTDPGIYALFLRPGVTLQLPEYCSEELKADFARYESRNGLIYIGKATNLQERLLETHFCSEQKHWSTVRRSLGAVLREGNQLRLVPKPWHDKPTDRNCELYGFDPDGEINLTRWMKSHLLVSFRSLFPVVNYKAVKRQESKNRRAVTTEAQSVTEKIDVELEQIETILIKDLRPILCLPSGRMRTDSDDLVALYVRKLRDKCKIEACTQIEQQK